MNTASESQKPAHEVKISMLCYNTESMQHFQQVDVANLQAQIPQGHIAWINLDGVHDTSLVNSVAEQFGLHELVLEDIMNTEERPKLEDYDTYMYWVMNMADLDANGMIRTEQVSIILGQDLILSFQEDPDDIFDVIRTQLRNPVSKVRKMGPDYLAYLLLDTVLDRYFFLLEHLDEKIDVLEEELMERPEKVSLKKIYNIKRELIVLRKSVWPMREVASNMQRNENPLVSSDLNVFLRDFYDHIMRVIDNVESYSDRISGMVDLYLSNSSIRMNEVMKVLTVISTIFIPLTFVTGFYGMNFKWMPELDSHWSYPLVIGIMLVMVVGQLIYFRKKNWL